MGDRGVVVAVDQVVRHAGMVRLLGKDLLQNSGGLELAGVRLVGRERSRVEGERVEDRCLPVIRIAKGELLHGFLVGESPSAVIDLVRVPVERLEPRDVISLALGLRSRSLRPFDGGPPFG